METRWYPIATAPRDRKILLTDGHDVAVAWWGYANVFDREGTWVYASVGNEYNDCLVFGDTYSTPTMWAPCPDLPKETR